MSNVTDQESPDSPPVDSAGSLREVGEALREGRGSQKLSLEEVAERLRLAPDIVDAIEAGDRDRLPAMTFVRGYIRSYARLLNINGQPLLAKIGGSDSQTVRPLSVNRPIRYRHAVPFGKWLLWVLLLAALGILAAYGIPAIERLFSAAPEPEEAPRLVLPQLGGKGEQGPVKEGMATPSDEVAPLSREPVLPATEQADDSTEESAPSAAASQEQSGHAPVKLTLLCREDSWVEITAEGKKQIMGIMRAGTSETIVAQPPFDILIGNASAVDIEYNGIAFDTAPFRRGKVVRFTLNH